MKGVGENKLDGGHMTLSNQDKYPQPERKKLINMIECQYKQEIYDDKDVSQESNGNDEVLLWCLKSCKQGHEGLSNFWQVLIYGILFWYFFNTIVAVLKHKYNSELKFEVKKYGKELYVHFIGTEKYIIQEFLFIIHTIN